MEDTIMKKTYINPAMQVIKIETQQMLAASDPNVSLGSGSVDAGSVESRSNDFWDDED
jgi:hypothetical protein